MAASEPLELIGLDMAALEQCQGLSVAAGWNQNGPDWRLFLTHGRCEGFRGPDGTIVATGAAFPYPQHFGFISMLLVSEPWRRRGLATRLLERAIEFLRQRELVPVLDATPAGAMVYARHGFTGVFEFERWQLDAGSAAAGGGEPPAADEAARFSALDASVFGTQRGFFFDDIFARDGSRAVFSDDGTGAALVRRGWRAWQVGPVIADSAAAAIDLLARVVSLVSGAVFVDVPVRWTAIADWLTARGATRQRGFTRMSLDRAEPFGEPGRQFALAGPEFG